MAKMTNKERRLKIFHCGSAGIAKYTDGNSSLYYCPICGAGYPESSAITGMDLTLEDVPPKSVGGKPILATCRQCNSSAGYKIDVCTANKKKFEEFERVLCGHKKATITSVTLSMADVDIMTSVCTEGGFDVIPLQNANSPATMEKYKEHLRNLAANSANGFEFKLSMTQKYDHRLDKLSQLKSAFLLVFAWLGYRYAFDPRLEVVRQQIREPENDILGTRFWIKGNQTFEKKTLEFFALTDLWDCKRLTWAEKEYKRELYKSTFGKMLPSTDNEYRWAFVTGIVGYNNNRTPNEFMQPTGQSGWSMAGEVVGTSSSFPARRLMIVLCIEDLFRHRVFSLVPGMGT